MKTKYILPILALIISVALLLYGPIAQNENYHHFADQRDVLGIPNFLNVITNLPFVVVAIVGLYVIHGMKTKMKLIGGVLFAGFALLTFGSSYYHLWPNNTTLVYDRVPIAMIIMSFFSLVIEDHLHPKRTTVCLAALNLVAILSVLYWALTENVGHGDLRWYAFAQFFPVIAIPIILLSFKSDFNYRKEVAFIYLFFILAKLSETFDKEIFFLLSYTISGHSLKHLLMAAAGYGIILLIGSRSK